MTEKSDLDALFAIYAAAFDAMNVSGPSGLLRRTKFEAEGIGEPEMAQTSFLIEHLSNASPGDKLLTRFRLTLATWDAKPMGAWIGNTEPGTPERRRLIYDLLKLDSKLADCLDRSIPQARNESVIVSTEFEPWYERVMAEREPFYWKHYSEYLSEIWADEGSVAAMDLNTTRIVERLSDPERPEAYQAKGLVVGYVQSGKTANFTGVIAKAIDAGYRLIIILTGQTDLLRTQTQRRIDKELVGDENLLRGIDLGDDEALQSVDYHGDPDRADFVSHGALPSTLGFSDIYRLTTKKGDYKSLAQGISSLDFDRLDPDKPLNSPVNLHRVPTRIAIVKKNKVVLTKLVKDLKRITAKLEDIPALIIDDESDQASLNTSNPKKWEKGRKERTRINGLISELLGRLPRGQYVGYTATPFANVFVDPSDAGDIFPRSFILSLDRPPGYMGAVDFHDLDVLPEDEVPSVFNSHQEAYVREIDEEDLDGAMQDALDMFVLSGAIKLYREEAEEDRHFKHHTMLIHESVRQSDHLELAEEVREMWKNGSYWGATGRTRLENLFHSDVAEVMEARNEDGISIPDEFEAVGPFIGEVVSRIDGVDNDPVLIVNGDKDAAREDVDFDSRPVWRILLGGAKLSRGFTVEGLTVSYYRRVTKQADTLMQMGRWFGFRDGYKDLVRLYIDRGGPTAAFDLYRAFEAACQSEELFRQEIRRYAEVKDGVPTITPRDIPPLVSQHLGWLKPSGTNKMYNARLVERRSPGENFEPTGYPEAAADIAHNNLAVAPLLTAACKDGAFDLSGSAEAKPLPARFGVIEHSALVDVLGRLRWRPGDHFEADLAWLEGLEPNQIEDWIVLLPQHLGNGAKAEVGDYGTLSVFRRRRRKGRGGLFGAISDPKHRPIAAQIAGVGDHDDELAAELHRERRGALMVYPIVEFEDGEVIPGKLETGEVVMALVIVAPVSTGSPDGTLVRFVARDPSQSEEPIVDSPHT